MKFDVEYHQKWRGKDPFKFWAKLLEGPPKRQRRRIATWTYVTRIDDENLEFYYQYKDHPKEQLCLLASNGTWTIAVPADKLTITYSFRIQYLTNVYVRSNRKYYSMYENPVRMHESHHWNITLPYQAGVQVYRGEILHKSRYVDKKRVIEMAAALEVRRKLKKIRELAPIMIRLLEAQKREPVRWHDRHQIKQDLFQEFDLDNVNALDAERVYLLGETCTSRRQEWRFHANGAHTIEFTDTEEAYRKRCIVNGLRKLREHIYSKEGVYQYKPTK